MSKHKHDLKHGGFLALIGLSCGLGVYAALNLILGG